MLLKYLVTTVVCISQAVASLEYRRPRYPTIPLYANLYASYACGSLLHNYLSNKQGHGWYGARIKAHQGG